MSEQAQQEDDESNGAVSESNNGLCKSDPECICRGNWRQIVSEYRHLLGRQYTDRDGDICNFFGIVHGDDDYYYGMWSKKKGLQLLSCVGDLDGFGYTLVPLE